MYLRGTGSVWRKEGGPAVDPTTGHELFVMVLRALLPLRLGLAVCCHRPVQRLQGG